MKMPLRVRVFLTLVPLLALLAVVGSAGVILLYQLGRSIDVILKENYASVLAMQHLNEALERIDSSFQFARAGKVEQAQRQYETNWPDYSKSLREEQANITLPGEAELVDRLVGLTDRYRRLGDEFFANARDDQERSARYFGSAEQVGLLAIFDEIKGVSGEILRINQQNMEDASARSRKLANDSLLWFAVGLVVAVCLAVLLALHTSRTILQPIRALTRSAIAIGAGNLDQVVPVVADDEIGRLAVAFNQMGRQLRHYRQTDYARLLRAQRTSQATIDSFPDPVLVVDAEGAIEMANPAARQLLGVAPELADHRPAPWQPPEFLRRPLAEALQKQGVYLPQGFDNAVRLACAGQDCFYLPRILSIRDPYGGTLGAAILLQDVTRFRLHDQFKSNMLATASHELKTPLTSVRLAVHLLLEETVGPLTPKQTELLLDARDNAERLLATINNLLDLTHLERGQEWLEKQTEAPAALLQLAAEAIAPRAEDKGIALHVEAAADLPAVEVDPERWAHAMNNLLDNAVRHTNRGGAITLSATAADEHVTFSVRDTGTGIAPEHLPHIFERFFRVPGQTAGTGTGLGLAITREIVAAHDGTITCTSQPGQGTTFRIVLPAYSQAHKADGADTTRKR
jgi:signal transduction histidine kinase